VVAELMGVCCVFVSAWDTREGRAQAVLLVRSQKLKLFVCEECMMQCGAIEQAVL
jgi:hypothetical protein